MTRDQIIEMMKKAGFKDLDSLVPMANDRFYHGFSREERLHLCTDDRIQRFAALVAAAEREECAREAEFYIKHSTVAKSIAKDIRARGKQ